MSQPTAQAPAKTTKPSRKAPKNGAAAEQPPAHAAEACEPELREILPALGLYGLAEVEPVILASLVTEDPLLLIGPHGTGKSMLLERLAEALGLRYRHYNASLICFDDLIGFPVPDKETTELKYLQTPATIWDAEAVFFDEVSRCKPDVQNKLFCIIHERKVQGLPLKKLRYRWSAMNPPLQVGGGEDYRGSEPLDAALADRYAFLVEIPDWFALDAAAQRRLLECGDQPPAPDAPDQLKSVVKEARLVWNRLAGQLRPLLAEYLRYLTVLLREAEVRLSGRRLVMMMRSIPAVHAVRLVLGNGAAGLEESVRLAVRFSCPGAAEGKAVDHVKVGAAHREAWRAASTGTTEELIRIFSLRSPVERAVVAAHSEKLDRMQRSIIVADCMQFMPLGARHALSFHLVESGQAAELVGAVAEQVAEDYALAAIPSRGSFSIYDDQRAGEEVLRKLETLDSDTPSALALQQLLAALFARGRLTEPSKVDTICADWTRTLDRIARLTQRPQEEARA